MKTIIETNKEFLNFFYEDDRDNILYQIPIHTLAEIRMSGDTILSEWVQHFSNHQVITRDNLYELAGYTQKFHPDNNINWVAQFMKVERIEYINFIKELHNQFQGKKYKGYESLLNTIEISHNESNEEVNQKIKLIVKENLKRYRII